MTNNQNAAAASASAAVETSDLKDKFRARSIPLEKDFHDLIDMADAGRLAAGLSPAQESTKAAATTGLTIDADKRLGVKLKTGGGLVVAPEGVSVKKGNGIDTNIDDMTVKADPNGGVIVTPGGVAVKTGDGLVVTPAGISIKLVPDGGIAVTEAGAALSLTLPSGQTLSSASVIQYIDSIYVKTLAALCGGNTVGYVADPNIGTVIFAEEPNNCYLAYAFPARGVVIPTDKYNPASDEVRYAPINVMGMMCPTATPTVYKPLGFGFGVTFLDFSEDPSWRFTTHAGVTVDYFRAHDGVAAGPLMTSPILMFVPF